MPSTPPTLHIVRYTDVDSTNRIALELGEQGAQHGTVISAGRQSGGRGRLGRSFSSPPGGLYFSLILRPEISPEHLSLLTLIAGVACCTVIERLSGLGIMLKWPNDLYLANRKLGGILCESASYSMRTGTIPFLVVGIGLNINTDPEKFPGELRDTVISLSTLRKRYYDTEHIMYEIAEQIMEFTADPSCIQEEVLDEWRRRDYLYGRKIVWQDAAGRKISGTGAGLFHDGRYGLRTAAGEIMPILGGELVITDAERKKS